MKNFFYIEVRGRGFVVRNMKVIFFFFENGIFNWCGIMEVCYRSFLLFRVCFIGNMDLKIVEVVGGLLLK